MAENSPLVILSIPGLRAKDAAGMPNLRRAMQSGEQVPLSASFPAVTWPVQANMLTGVLPKEHGVTANGFYWRDSFEVEMWTAWNDKIQKPQIWDRLHSIAAPKSSAVWFPMLSKGAGADYICMPAPIHNPDGSESLWCYTKPVSFYGELRDQLGHFPLQNFWGPMAGIPSSDWIAKSAIVGAKKFTPDFFFIYIPHLDYAAQKLGPDCTQAGEAVLQLDRLLGEFFTDFQTAYPDQTPTFVVVSEYVITSVNHVLYPNRMLREAGLLKTTLQPTGGELIDFENSMAWALVDHQFSHIYVRGGDTQVAARIARMFQGQPGVAEVLVGHERSRYAMDHERSGEVIVISEPNSWQAYYWWQDDAKAPDFARKVDIHQKPGYDPVELHFDPVNRCIPLDATKICGSHGAPPRDASQIGVALSSRAGVLGDQPLKDTDIYHRVMRYFGVA